METMGDLNFLHFLLTLSDITRTLSVLNFPCCDLIRLLLVMLAVN